MSRAPDGAMVAFCGSDQFGDYEHGAFFLGLEPKAIERAREAEVVFLGNSRGQFAFSTGSTTAYFADRLISHYMLGFAYDERSEFALDIMLRRNIRPKVLIINADPFFSRRPSEVAKSLSNGGLSLWLRYIRKKLAHLSAGFICPSFRSLCSAKPLVIYREAGDGAWRGFDMQEDVFPVPVSLPPMVGRGLEDAQTEARSFISKLGVRPECIVLTAIPQTFDDPGPFVRGLAEAIGTPVIIPRLQGLVTFDQAHLNGVSAERWSRAFLQELDPVLRRCLPG